MNLSVQWTKHLKDPKEKAAFEAALRGSGVIVNRTLALLQEADQALEAKQLSSDFTSPSWAMQQAYINGQRSKIKELAQLFSFMKP